MDEALVDDGLSTVELLREVRAQLRELNEKVDAIARDQAAGVERRESMRRVADAFSNRLEDHAKRIDELEKWRDKADAGMTLARWALGTSLASAVGVIALIAKSIDPSLP